MVLRDNVCCTLRVCEVVFNLLELLIDMGVLKTQHSDHDSGSEYDNLPPEPEREQPKTNNKIETPHGFVMNCVIRYGSQGLALWGSLYFINDIPLLSVG